MKFPFPVVPDHGTQQNFEYLGEQFPLAAGTANFAAFPHVRAYKSVAQTIANTTLTALAFGSERWDSGTTTEQHSITTNTGRLTAQVAGLYQIGGRVEWTNNSTGKRFLEIFANGVTRVDGDGRPASAESEHSISSQWRMAVGEYVELRAYQASGGVLDVTAAEFWMSWVSS